MQPDTGSLNRRNRPQIPGFEQPASYTRAPQPPRVPEPRNRPQIPSRPGTSFLCALTSSPAFPVLNLRMHRKIAFRDPLASRPGIRRPGIIASAVPSVAGSGLDAAGSWRQRVAGSLRPTVATRPAAAGPAVATRPAAAGPTRPAAGSRVQGPGSEGWPRVGPWRAGGPEGWPRAGPKLRALRASDDDRLCVTTIRDPLVSH